MRNSALLAVTNAVYYWRAKTEEAHLGTDADYRAYSAWMERHAVVPRFFAWLIGRKPQPEGRVQPAE